MDQNHKTWAIRAGIGAATCALLTAWMVPNTTPTAKPSVIAGMSGTAEAQKPTYSAIPDSAIPSWAANLQPAPAAMPMTAPLAPVQIADAGAMPTDAAWKGTDWAGAPPPPDEAPPPDPAPQMDAAPPPPQITARADPPPPVAQAAAPADGYQAQRAAWQARLDSVMQGQHGPGGNG